MWANAQRDGRPVEYRWSIQNYLYKLFGKRQLPAEMGDRARAKWAEKRWDAVTLSVAGAGSPSNTMPPGPRTISVPSGMATIHERYRQDRQTGQDNGPIA